MNKQSIDELHEWSSRVSAATTDLDVARQALAADKKQRKASITARVGDWFTTTPAEAAERDAAGRLATLKDEAENAVQRWIGETARELLESSEVEDAKHKIHLQKVAAIRTRRDQVQRWFDLAEAAHACLARAKRSCESASTSELLDAVSSNKAFSLMSSIDTSNARDSVRAADGAVQALADALPKRAGAAPIDTPDDLLDFMLDIAFDTGFDMLSWFNMDKLDEAARRCGHAMDALQPLRVRLGQLLSESQERFDKALEALRSVEAPFLEQAAGLVPSEIRLPPPVSIPPFED